MNTPNWQLNLLWGGCLVRRVCLHSWENNEGQSENRRGDDNNQDKNRSIFGTNQNRFEYKRHQTQYNCTEVVFV